MPYDAPGFADTLSPALLERWNEVIRENHQRLLPEYETGFFSLEPDALRNPVRAHVKWFGDPAEPAVCIDRAAAKRLSDWGWRGRHQLHNEYVEYAHVWRQDASGTWRIKRVTVTTELREYWTMIAEHSPNGLRSLVRDTIGRTPSWQQLYAHDFPFELTPNERKIAFSRQCAGHGDDPALIAAGVPAQPDGNLNRDHALFMTHPINGLDDLIQIVLIGARPYMRETTDGLKPATKAQVFRMRVGQERLACRHADPAAAMSAHGAACEGRTVALANPIGVYLLTMNADLFLLRGEPVPKHWIHFSRGKPGMFQRLEFGPPDDEPEFLDDIMVAAGSSEEALTGGYQLLQHIEIGPLVLVGEGRALSETEHIIATTSDAPVRCHEAAVCTEIRELQALYEREHP
jgi:hypothetical protein